jgi:hypothetical protein
VKIAIQMGLLAALAQLACGSPGDVAEGGQDAGTGEPRDEWDERLGEREVDYNAALRVAALRLTGELPTLAEIKSVANAGDLPAQRTVYRALVKSYIDGPLFARQMFRFWRDALKVGGTDVLDTAPAFAAQVVVDGRPYTDLFTATAGTCSTFDRESNTITAADCANGVPAHAGLLTHPAVMGHFFSNMAFRRVRWVQEVFDCTAFPVEMGEPQDVGGAADYTGVWPFESVASLDTGGNVDFQDAKSVVCANCHQTMNHLAPLFANFDADGAWQDTISVPLPLDGAPPARFEDWLVAGEETAWRYGVPAADLPALGQVMAGDPQIAQCAVARVWNWALGKQDIVDALTVVPSAVVADQVAAFTEGGYQLKSVIYSVFTSDDFVRF